MPPTPRLRPYKDFLTPALHRRFALATAILWGLCYVESLIIGEFKSFFWSWFPFGRAGIRAALLFIPAFMIFILRVAQLHVGLRTSYSAWDTFRQYAYSYQVAQTLGCYFISAFIFSEIYIWSAAKGADLNRVKMLSKTERLTLNEVPIYLTSYLIFLSVAQAGAHLFYDYDRIDLPVTKTKLEASSAPSDQRAHSIIPPTTELKTKLPGLILTSFKRAFAVAVVSPLIYCMDFGIYPGSVRRFAWSYTRTWAKMFYHLPKSNALPSIRPFHFTVLGRTVASGFLLVLLWEVGNAAFSAYTAQEPLKNDRPITYESRDPNGSLLTGLKGKKLQTRAFAFWELVYIAQRFEGRRKVIFEDIDRKGGSTWSQILTICLDNINGMDSRITDYLAPPQPKPVLKSVENGDISPLPRLAPPLKDNLSRPGDLFGKPNAPKGAGQAVAKFAQDYAKSHGQSPSGGLSPKSRKLLDKIESAVLTPAQKAAADAQGVGGLFRQWAIWLLQSKMGWPFRQEYRRRISAIVLGSPYGDVGIIVDSIDSLTRLAVCSLNEDKYGNVQRDVRLIIQTLTKAVTKLEGFKAKLDFHWTDVERKQECPEVDTILAALKGGLNELVTAFGDYSEDLRLSQSEMRMAREAATPAPKKPEMAENAR